MLVEGRMQTRSWDDKTSGEKKYRTEIVADRVQFGPRPGSGMGGSSATQGSGGKKSDSASEEKPQSGGAIEYPEEDINPEDIPF